MNARVSPKDTPTTDEMRTRVAEVEALIQAKTEARTQMLENLEGLISRLPIGDISIARERKRHAEIDADINALRQSLAVLKQRLHEAQQRAIDEAWKRDFDRSVAAGNKLKDANSRLQKAVDDLVPLAMAVREADTEFVASLRRKPPDFDERQISITLARIIALRLYVQSDGEIRPERVTDSPYELRESGRVDFVQRASDYTKVALRGNSVPPLLSDFTPPEAA